MKAVANWQVCIEVNVSFDHGLSLLTNDFIRRTLTSHPTALVIDYSDDGAKVVVGPSHLESLLIKLQGCSTPLSRLSFAVSTVTVESLDCDDEDGIFDVGGDDHDDSFFTLTEERPLIRNEQH